MKRLVVPLLCLAAAFAQDELAPLRERAAGLVGMGKYSEAEPILTRALGLGQLDGYAEDVSLLPIIGDLAALYRAQGRNAEAEKFYQRSLALRTKIAMSGSVSVVLAAGASAGRTSGA